jgi:hypothetical protein
MHQFWNLYYKKGMHPQIQKVNGFRPSTWSRLSEIPIHRKRVKKSSLPPIPAPVVLAIKSKPKKKHPDPVPKREKTPIQAKPVLVKRLSRMKSMLRSSGTEPGNIYPMNLGLDRLDAKFKANYKTILDLLANHPNQTGIAWTDHQQQLITSCLRNYGAFRKMTDSIFRQMLSVIKLEKFEYKTRVRDLYENG